MIKSIFLSLIPCFLLGFSFYEKDDAQLYRTPEGVVLIPSTANISEEDAREVYQILSQEDEPVGSLLFNFGGRQYTHGEISMEDILEAESEFNVDLINPNETPDIAELKIGIFKNLFERRKRKCYTTWDADKCKRVYKFFEDRAIEVGINTVTDIGGILDKYEYITIEP